MTRRDTSADGAEALSAAIAAENRAETTLTGWDINDIRTALQEADAALKQAEGSLKNMGLVRRIRGARERIGRAVGVLSTAKAKQ